MAPTPATCSTFRAASATIPGIGSGTFMNFNPTGGTTLELPITTYINGAQLTFEYDQPFAAQEPAGATGRVTSDVDIEVLNSSGQVVVGADQNINNVAMQMPWQGIVIPSPGNYYLAIHVLSGPNPGHVEIAGYNDTNAALSISQEFGSAGGTSYPTSFGHSTAAATIGVGAMPWWAAAPYLGQNPLESEPFSASGPAIYDLSIQGTPTTPRVVQNPIITAPDGGTTTFFEPGGIVDTTEPLFPGEATTATDLVPADQQGLPSFFGTSQAAPDAAAVAALMLQVAPSLTPAQVRGDLIASARPMNGARRVAGIRRPVTG